MKFHLARLGWARGVRVGTEMRWGYRGISRPDWKDLGHKAYKRENPSEHPLVHALLQCEHYMQSLWDAELKYYLNSDSDEEWREYCEERCHEHDCCPEKHPDDYKAAVADMLEDEDARCQWGNNCLDWDWIRAFVHTLVDDDESVEYFLKEHPVDEVYCVTDDEWYDLDEVAGYCFDCNTPITPASVRKAHGDWGGVGKDQSFPIEPAIPHHRWHPNCDICPCGDANTPEAPCFFDEEANVRQSYHCPNCNESTFTDDLEVKRDRPFEWPPFVPYPPYRGWAGEYWDVPPNARS